MTSVTPAPDPSPGPNTSAGHESPTPPGSSPTRIPTADEASPENLEIQEEDVEQPEHEASSSPIPVEDDDNEGEQEDEHNKGVNLSVKPETNTQNERKESSSSAMTPPEAIPSPATSPKDHVSVLSNSTTIHQLSQPGRIGVDGKASRPLRLRRVNHSQEIVSGFKELLKNESLTDVTLSCQGGLTIKAHRVILATFSPYFKSIFESHTFSESPWTYPVVVLKEYGILDIKAIVEFIYRGEVSVPRDRLPSVLATARALEVSGLADLKAENFEGGVPAASASSSSSLLPRHPPSSLSSGNNGLPSSLAALRSLGGGSLTSVAASVEANVSGTKRSFNVASSPVSSSSTLPLDLPHGYDNDMALVMAKKLRTCLQPENNRNSSPSRESPSGNPFLGSALNLSANLDGVRSPILSSQQHQTSSSPTDYLSGRLPASVLGQIVQHQLMQQQQQQKAKAAAEQQQRINSVQRSLHHLQQSSNLKQQILQQQLMRAKTNGLNNSSSTTSSPSNTGSTTGNSNRSSTSIYGSPAVGHPIPSPTLAQQFQARLRQQIQEKQHSLMVQGNHHQDADEEEEDMKGNGALDRRVFNYGDGGHDEEEEEDSPQKKNQAVNGQTSLDDKTDDEEYDQDIDRDSIFHRQQKQRLQQIQKQQHQYALQMQLEQDEQEQRLLDYHQSISQSTHDVDNDNDSSTGFDWQEGFTDDLPYGRKNESGRQNQLQIANINSNSNGKNFSGNGSNGSGVSTPDFLQPRGPGRPRKGNKAQEISPCPECNKVFVRPDVLKLHYRSVHLNERHPCNLCPKIFKWPGDLSKHKRTKHPDKYPPVNALTAQ